MKLLILPSLLSIILMSSVCFISCAQSGPEGQEGYEKVSPEAFETAMSLEGMQLVDVRTADEFSEGYIEGAVNYDYLSDEIPSLISSLDKSKPVLVYCRSGKRSASSAELLLEAGFSQVYDLEGGFLAWQKYIEDK